MSFTFSLNSQSDQQLALAANEAFGETPQLLQSSLLDLRCWLSKSPHLHSIQQDDLILKTFLRGCKYSLERTKEKLDNFHTVKGRVPEWFGDWDPNQARAQEMLNWGAYIPLPGFDKKGRMVLLWRIQAIQPSKCSFDDMMWIMQMVITTAVQKCEEQMVIQGLVMINDLSGATAAHLSLFNLAVMKKLITMLETAMPMKPKAEHILNMPRLFESMFSLVQGMQKQKMRARTRVHKGGDLSGLHEDLGTEILPLEYGGTNGSLAELTDYWKAEVTANRSHLLHMSQYKTDERLRPGRPKTTADIFGIEGSFRKLDID